MRKILKNIKAYNILDWILKYNFRLSIIITIIILVIFLEK